MRTLLAALLLLPLAALGFASQHAPAGTFTESFLILPEEVADAAKTGRRVVVFFEQENCNPCARMARTTLADPAVVKRLRERFVLVAVDLNGARETVWMDGVARPEKALGSRLGVRGTPTLLFLDERGSIVQQFSGYRDPQAFLAVLEAAAPR